MKMCQSLARRGVGGGGAVLRDHNEAFSGGADHFFPMTVNPEITEMLLGRTSIYSWITRW